MAVRIDSLRGIGFPKRTTIMHDVVTYPGSRNTNFLKLVKVRFGIGGSLDELKVDAGDA